MSTNTFLQADADSRDVWLVTTGAYPFYEMLGFSIVRSFVVGNDNPTWVKEPVTVRVVSRAPTSTPRGSNCTEHDHADAQTLEEVNRGRLVILVCDDTYRLM